MERKFNIDVEANKGLRVKTFNYTITSEDNVDDAIKKAESYTKNKGYEIIKSKLS